MKFSVTGRPTKPDIDDASEADWKVADQRAQALDRLLLHGAGPPEVAESAQELGLSAAMVYRLLARYRLNPVPMCSKWK